MARRLGKWTGGSGATGGSSSSTGTAIKVTTKMAKWAWRLARMAWRSVHRSLRLLLTLGPIPLVIVIVVLFFGVSGAMAAVIGEKLAGFAGITKDMIPDLDPDQVKEIEEAIGPELIEALDCSTLAPAERRPGENCIEGLIAEDDFSPIPKDKEWLIPVWEDAGKRYQVPWELLAAINATRSHFGDLNCEKDEGVGFYRMDESAWAATNVNAGSSKVSHDSISCANTTEPAAVFSTYKKGWKPGQSEPEGGEGDYFDAVDSTFATAKLLAVEGAFGQKEWKYSGSPSGSCTSSEGDGRIWYLPDFSGGGGATGIEGYNKKLPLPGWIISHSAKWRKAHEPSTSYEGAMSTGMIIRYLETIWQAFGANPREAAANARANIKQVMQESGGRSHAIQTVIDVNSGGNEAGGLLQFIPSTFDTWNVDGFNDRFAPLDNLLAAVNAQVNADAIYTTGAGQVEVLAGQGGWGPTGGSNPYDSGGAKGNLAKMPGGDGGSAPTGKPEPYKGKPQKDKVSLAVREDGSRVMSPCYVAVVNDWYKAIVKWSERYEGGAGGVSGPLNLKKAVKVEGKGKLVPIPSPPASAPGMQIDSRILENVLWVAKRWNLSITQGRGLYPPSVSHNYGLAIDAVAPAGKSWDETATAAALGLGWEPGCGSSGLNSDNGGSCSKMVPAIRFIGYDGYPNHGAGNHIHISWDCDCPGGYDGADHGLAGWVEVFPSGKSGGDKKGGAKPGGKSKRPAGKGGKKDGGKKQSGGSKGDKSKKGR